MNILVIPTSDWTKFPVPNRLNFVFDRLAKRNEVHVIHFELARFRNSVPRETRCILHSMGSSSIQDLSVYYTVNSFKHASRIKRIVSDNDIEIIVSANIMPGFMVSLRDNLPMVVDYLDHFEQSASVYYPENAFAIPVKALTRFLVSKSLSAADTILTVSSQMKAFLTERGFKNVEVIPNGVDTNIVRPIPTEEAKQLFGLDGIVLGYLGVLEHWIDLESVVRALPELEARGYNVTLFVVGPSLFTDYGLKLRKMAKKMGVLEKIHFTGNMRYEDVSKTISAMDVCLNPRKPLAMNLMTIGGKVFDYLACGKPVLSTNMKPLESLFTRQNGVFFYNESDFVERVIEVLSMEHDGNQYRKTALSYDWEILSQQYEDVLRGTLQQHTT